MLAGIIVAFIAGIGVGILIGLVIVPDRNVIIGSRIEVDGRPATLEEVIGIARDDFDWPEVARLETIRQMRDEDAD